MPPNKENSADGVDPAFEVHPSVLFRLGEELIQDEVQAIAELVKNSYDANARSARVEVIRNGQDPGGTGLLLISDDGDGMTEDILRTAFLTLADSPKRKIKESGAVGPGKRMPLGDKGLGRLGAQRLGRVLSVRTRPATVGREAVLEHEMTIDWSRVALADRLSDVRFPITTRELPEGSKAGTDLKISDLRSVETYEPQNRPALQQQMVRLVSPFGAKRGFNIGLIVDGEMQASVAFNKELMKENYPFSELVDKDVNTLIFPNLASGNIAYNLMKELDTADAVGPILLGLNKPVHILQLGSSVRSILNMALVAVVDAQIKSMAPTDEIVKKSKWWKRFRKDSRDH